VDIPALVERALEACSGEPLSVREQVREADRAARATVREALATGVPG
jgi:hypothetical protein